MSHQPRRPMFAHEARSLLREAVRLNITARKIGRASKFSEERDQILADLEAAGYPTNVNDFKHPMDV